MQMIKQGLLTAPKDYWDMPEFVRKEICNGAGAKGSGFLVPDTTWGLNCTPCFNIHDYCYHFWSDSSGKEVADRLMLDNLYEWIEAKTSKAWYAKPLLFARKRRAYKYYLAVKVFGTWFYND